MYDLDTVLLSLSIIQGSYSYCYTVGMVQGSLNNLSVLWLRVSCHWLAINIIHSPNVIIDTSGSKYFLSGRRHEPWIDIFVFYRKSDTMVLSLRIRRLRYSSRDSWRETSEYLCGYRHDPCSVKLRKAESGGWTQDLYSEHLPLYIRVRLSSSRLAFTSPYSVLCTQW